MTYFFLSILVTSSDILNLETSRCQVNLTVLTRDFRKSGLWTILATLADIDHKGRHQNSLPLTTNVSQNVTEPSEGISYPVGDLCRRFTKLTGSSAYTLHSNPIPPTDGTNGLLWLVAYVSQTGQQCFPACFCHPTVGNFGISPNKRQILRSLVFAIINKSIDIMIRTLCNTVFT